MNGMQLRTIYRAILAMPLKKTTRPDLAADLAALKSDLNESEPITTAPEPQPTQRENVIGIGTAQQMIITKIRQALVVHTRVDLGCTRGFSPYLYWRHNRCSLPHFKR